MSENEVFICWNFLLILNSIFIDKKLENQNLLYKSVKLRIFKAKKSSQTR